MAFKCANALGIIFGVLAAALHVIILPIEWYPDSDMGTVMKEDGTLNVQQRILPIVCVVILIIALLGLLYDLKADKIPLRLFCIAMFLAASAVIIYSGGWFIYQMIRYAAGDETLNWDDISQSVKDNLGDWNNFQNLDNANFNSWWTSVTGFDWSSLKLKPGPFVAICAGVVDLIVCLMYACMSCCGLCS